MSNRKTISVDEDVHERLDDIKKEDWSFNDLLDALADCYESHNGDVNTQVNTDALPDGVLTENHIDDIANQVAQNTADEVETRLQRR
jgi:hypothetical protein